MMKLVENEIFHVYNRGNQQQKIFFRRANYLYFLQKVRIHLIPHCDMLAYCLMPNHFHFLIKTDSRTIASPKKAHPIARTVFSKELGKMLSSYTRAMQKQEKFSGSLFQQKTKAKQVSGDFVDGEDYVLQCFRYILFNPVKAGLVSLPEEWEFSNFQDLIGRRNGDLCNAELIHKELALDLTSIDAIFSDALMNLKEDSLF